MRQILHKIQVNRLQALLFLLLLFTAAMFLLKPIYDADFFWHLRTGQWIWQAGTLPDRDPFNFTTGAVVTNAIHFTLTSYWLSQVMFYLAFLGGGMGGIVALRFLFAAALLYTMHKRQQGDGIITMSLLVFFTIAIVNFYFFERPQILSFVFFAMMLLFLERIRNGSAPESAGEKGFAANKDIFFLAIVMFLWSNSHGGHLLGQITVLIVLVVEGVKYLHRGLRPMPPARYVRLLIAGCFVIICSLVNPNNYQAFMLMLQTRAGDPSSQIQEYSTLLEMYNDTHAPVIIIYFAIIFLTGIALAATPKKTDLTEMVLLTFLGYFAFKYVRYAAFFPIAALPLLGKRLSSDPVVRYARWLLPPLALVAVYICGSGEFSANIATARSGKWVSDRFFPEKTADFIIASNIQGNMYNPYNWGGYLIWRLAPERKVYADGRNLNIDFFKQVSLPSLLKKYDINYIITYSHEPTGEITAVASDLLKGREWLPVFLDRRSRSAVFVRNVAVNAAVLARRPYISF